ncbi:MAG: CPBP family intramembrane metalloprotease [Deferribacteres bacterium]|nr:CPBP family intramembrane metalloprotease [Deferribacteres bacterium]
MSDFETQTTQWPEPKDIFLLLLFTFMLLIFTPILLEQLQILPMDSQWQLLLGECLIILPAIFYVQKKNLPLKLAFRFNKTNSKVVLLSFFMGFPLTLIFEEINLLIDTFIPMPEDIVTLYAQIFTANSVSEWLFLLITVVLFAGVFEEAIFRGLLQQVLEHDLDVTRAVLTTAFVFAFMHGNPFAVVQIVFLGVIIGVLAWRSDSVWPAVIVHATHNFISIVLVNTSEENLAFLNWHGHINPAFLFIAIAFLYYLIREFYQATE